MTIIRESSGDDVSINLALSQTGDYSGLSSNARILYPWSDPQLLDDPTELPAGAGNSVSWSPNGEFLAVGHDGAPYLTVYQRSGKSFFKLTLGDPPTDTVNDVKWSLNGEFLAVATSLETLIYQRSENMLTKLNYAATSSSGANGISWSFNGEYLAVTGTNFLTIYQRNGTNFTEVTGINIPSEAGNKVSWSPTGDLLVVVSDTSPYFIIYQISGSTFIRHNSGLSLEGAAKDVTWSPDGRFLAMALSVSPYIAIFERDGDLTRLSNPNTLPVNSASSVSFSLDGKHLAVGHLDDPFFTIYDNDITSFVKLTDASTAPIGTVGGGVNGLAFSPSKEFLAIAHDVSPFISVYRTSSIKLGKASIIQTARIIPQDSISYPAYEITANEILGAQLLSWHDATIASSLTLDGSNNVTTWADASGNGYDVSVNLGNAPSLDVSDAFGTGRNSILFDRANSEFLDRTTSPIVGTSTFYVWISFVSDDSINYQVLAGWGGSSSVNHYFQAVASGNVAIDPLTFGRKAGVTAYSAVTTTGYTVDQPHIMKLAQIASNDAKVWIDTGGLGTRTNSVTPSSIIHFAIGNLVRNGAAVTGAMSGNIGEVVIANSSGLTAGQITAMDDYMAAKWQP